MARKRMISPEIWESEDFSELSTLAKLVFIGLFSNADDEGRGKANPAYIKSTLFRYEEKMRITDIETTLDEIALHMSIIFYTYDYREYYQLTNWDAWQKVDKPQKSKIKPYNSEYAEIIRGTFGEQSANVRGTVSPNRIEKNKNKNKNRKEEDILSGAEAPDRQAAEIKSIEDNPFIELPLNDKSMFSVYSSYIGEMKELYPAVDIERELRKMKAWLISNPSRLKTRTGITRFMNSWFAREQDKGGSSHGNDKNTNAAGDGANAFGGQFYGTVL